MVAWRGGPRYNRLIDDFNRMVRLKKESTILDFKAAGDPPERYLVTFHGRGLKMKDGNVVPQDEHEVELRLGMEYPRARPFIQWKTPILHPNIFGGTVCLGRLSMEWTMAIHLDDLVEILWDYARLAVLNPLSAGPGAPNEKDIWTRLAEEYGFPVDQRALRDKVVRRDEGSSILRPEVKAAEDVVFLDDDSGVCGLGDLSERLAGLVKRMLNEIVSEVAALPQGRWCGLVYGEDIREALRDKTLGADDEELLASLAGAIACRMPDGQEEIVLYRHEQALSEAWAEIMAQAATL